MDRGFPPGLLEIEKLAAGPVELSGRLPADGRAWGADELQLLDAPRIVLRAEASADGGVRVLGRVSARVGLTCRRCLADVAHDVDLEIDVRLDPGVEPWEETEGVYALDPEAAEVDLVPIVREELLLAVPEFPLCRPDCGGLCPRCGADRNEGDCGCRPETLDPRWNALREHFPPEREPGTRSRGPNDDG